jgi:hypothetical protein
MISEANYTYSGKRYPIFKGMVTQAYRNLNRQAPNGQAIFSLRSSQPVKQTGFDPIKRGHVFHHATSLRLVDCKVKISEAGWRKSQSTNIKSVFAAIEGRLVEWDFTFSSQFLGEEIKFDRSIFPCFFSGNHPVGHIQELIIGSVKVNGSCRPKMWVIR